MFKLKSLLCAALALLLLAVPPACGEELDGDFQDDYEAYSESISYSGPHRVQDENGKWALADASGFLLTDYVYDNMSVMFDEHFETVFFIMERDGHFGVIDKAGNEVAPAVYDEIDDEFEQHVAAVRLGKKWGYIDEAGRLVIGPWFDEAFGFSEGLAPVRQGDKWGYIDHTGSFVIEPKYDDADYFDDVYAEVEMDGKWGLIDRAGDWVLEPEFSDDAEFNVDDDGLISVTEDYGGHFRYFDVSSGTAVEVKSVASGIDLSDYRPFKGKKVAKLDKKATLDKKTSKDDPLPRLDGATALFPVYAAFCQAVYPKDTRYTSPDKADESTLITCTKTNRAYERLIDGEADVIFVAQPSEDELAMAAAKGVEFDMRPFGKEAFVFIVNKDNPLNSITVDQIRDIYSGKITDWSQLGVEGLGPIVAYQRPENSGSQTALQALMGDTPLMEPLEGVVAWDMGDIVETIEYRNTANAIGYSFRFFCTDMMESDVKLLAVDGVEPTEPNIRNGSYPITSTLYAISLRGSDNPNVASLLDWIQSPQGMELVEKSGYTPWEE